MADRDADRNETNREIDITRRRVTSEVASEGGSPGDVEVGVDRQPTTGSEAGETARPTLPELSERAFDETGEGRRNP